MRTDLQGMIAEVLSAFKNNQELTPVVDNTFLLQLSSFLFALLDEQLPDKRKKDPMELKVDRQLLCSICIDIIRQSIPLQSYYNVFREMNYPPGSPYARQLYNNTLFSRGYKTENGAIHHDSFRILIFPFADLRYYLSEFEFGVVSDEYIFRRFREMSNEEHRFQLKNLRYKKPKSYFWVMRYEEFLSVMKEDRATVTRKLVDRLGLTHFDFEDQKYQQFFFLDLGEGQRPAYRPDATIVNWSSSVGFLSGVDALHGMTFSITGYAQFRNGFHEVILDELVLDEQKVRLAALPERISPPMKVHPDDIVREGITRFKSRTK